MDKSKHRQAQLAIEGAIDAILSVIEFTEAPSDRYRETMRKLNEDDAKFRDN